MWFEKLKQSQRRRQRKQLWSHRRLVVTHFIVRHIQQKTNFTQTTVNKRTKRLGFWCLSHCRRRSSFFRHCSSGRLLCTRIEYAPWLVRVEGKCKRPSDNWFKGPFGASNKNLRATSQTLLTAIRLRLRRRLPLGTLRSNDSTATRTSFKVNLRSFSLYRNHYPLTMSNVGERSWTWIPRDHNHVQKEIKFRLLVQSCCLLIKPIDFSPFALPSASLDLKVPIMADPEDYRHWQSKRAARLRPPWAEWSARWQSLDNDTSLTAAPRVSKLAKTLLLVFLNNT